MKRRPIVILVCVYIVFLIWILVWQPRVGECIFNWNEQENGLKERYEKRREFEALVLEVQKKQEGFRARVRLQVEAEQKENVECILILEKGSEENIQEGCTIKFKGEILWPEKETNPGQWNGRQYARINKIDFYIKVFEWKYIEIKDSWWLYEIGRVRRWFAGRIESIWQNENAEIIKAMLLGDTGNMNESTTELFRKGGISHVIAISGLHLSILS